MEYLSPQEVLLPQVYGTTASPLWLELRGPAAWQATPSWAVCRHACHQLLPWPWATFAMVRDAARPGSHQWPWGTAPATGPVGRLGRPSASDPRGVGCGVLSLCCPWCMCVCGVLATDQPTLTNYTEPLNDQPSNHNDLLRTPGPPGERKLDPVRRCEYASRHASPVARASSSHLTPTENQPRCGCLQDRAFGLAPCPWTPESGG